MPGSKEYKKAWYETNKERILLKAKEYRKRPEVIERNKNYKRDKNKQYKTQKIWRDKNKSKILNYRKNWTAKNPTYFSEYYEKNKKHIKLRVCEYFKTPQGKIVLSRVKHHRRNGTKSTLTLLEWLEIIDKQDNRCNICKCKFTAVRKKPTKDHIIPASRGGALVKENVQALCLKCNIKKGTQLPGLL